jgi:hypothetical protein
LSLCGTRIVEIGLRPRLPMPMKYLLSMMPKLLHYVPNMRCSHRTESVGAHYMWEALVPRYCYRYVYAYV